MAWGTLRGALDQVSGALEEALHPRGPPRWSLRIPLGVLRPLKRAALGGLQSSMSPGDPPFVLSSAFQRKHI